MPNIKAAGGATSERREEAEDHGSDHEKCVAFLVSKAKVVRLHGGQASVRASFARRDTLGAGFYPATVNCVLQGGAFSGPISQGNGADTYVLRLGSEGVQDVLTKFSARPDSGTKQSRDIIRGIKRLLGDLAKK